MIHQESKTSRCRDYSTQSLHTAKKQMKRCSASPISKGTQHTELSLHTPQKDRKPVLAQTEKLGPLGTYSDASKKKMLTAIWSRNFTSDYTHIKELMPAHSRPWIIMHNSQDTQQWRCPQTEQTQSAGAGVWPSRPTTDTSWGTCSPDERAWPHAPTDAL